MSDINDSVQIKDNTQPANGDQQCVARFAQDAMKQNADPTVWNKPAQDNTVSTLDTSGQTALFHDSSLPAGMSTMGSAEPGASSTTANFKNELQAADSVVKDVSKLFSDVSNMPGASDGRLAQDTDKVAKSALDLVSGVLEELRAELGQDSNPTSGGPAGGTTDKPPTSTGTDGGVTTDKPPTSTGTDGGGTTDKPPTSTGTDGGVTTDKPPTSTGTDGGVTTDKPPTSTGTDGGVTTDKPPTSTGTDGGVTTDKPPTSTGTDGGVTTDKPPTSTGTDGGVTTDKPPTVPPIANTTGNFTVENGQIIGPDGKPFIAKGVASYSDSALADESTMIQNYPGMNILRLPTSPTKDSPADVQKIIDAYNAKGIVVEVEDHSSAGTDGTFSNVVSGQDLANEEQWYSQIAAANVNNPMAWFGTANEPNNPGNQQAVVDQEVGIYNAIRSTGNNNMVMMELLGGGDASPMQADPGAYANMSNVAWDAHYYGWVSGFSTDQNAVNQGLSSEVQAAQTVKGAQGIIPVVVGEYGNSTTGGPIDANGTQVITAVDSSGLGSIAWVYNGGPKTDGSDVLTDGSGNLTPEGQQVAQFVNS